MINSMKTKKNENLMEILRTKNKKKFILIKTDT